MENHNYSSNNYDKFSKIIEYQKKMFASIKDEISEERNKEADNRIKFLNHTVEFFNKTIQEQKKTLKDKVIQAKTSIDNFERQSNAKNN